MKIAAISGSFRASSINTGLLRALAEVAPDGVTVEIIDYKNIPLYDQDVNEQGIPQSVITVGEKIAAADAVIIATPEYNHSIPGVLKNAIDWISRLPEIPINEKPLAIVGASPSFMGTARAQIHLRQSLQYLNPIVLNKPEVLVNNAFERFDDEGNLTDEKTKEHLAGLLHALMLLTKRLS